MRKKRTGNGKKNGSAVGGVGKEGEPGDMPLMPPILDTRFLVSWSDWSNYLMLSDLTPTVM